MPVSPGNSRTGRTSRQHLPLTPAVTTVRRGGHRPVVVSAPETPQPVASGPAVGLSLISSARGVRLSPR